MQIEEGNLRCVRRFNDFKENNGFLFLMLIFFKYNIDSQKKIIVFFCFSGEIIDVCLCVKCYSKKKYIYG